jgi:hypothetical protein
LAEPRELGVKDHHVLSELGATSGEERLSELREALCALAWRGPQALWAHHRDQLRVTREARQLRSLLKGMLLKL